MRFTGCWRGRRWFVLLYMSLFYDSGMKAEDPQLQLWRFRGGTFNRSGVLPEEWEQNADLFGAASLKK